MQDPDFLIRLVRAGHGMVYNDTPLSVLFDDASAGRISSNNSETNMRDWLARSEGILTPRARKGFELYALAYEVSLRSKLEGLRHIVRHAFSGAVAPRVVAKSAFRVMSPQAMFKQAAQLVLRGNADANKPELIAFLAEIETMAATRLMADLSPKMQTQPS